MLFRSSGFLWLVVAAMALIPIATTWADVIPSSGIDYSYPSGTIGSGSSYTDPDLSKLTDGEGGGELWTGMYVGWNATNTSPNNAVIRFDLGTAYHLSEVVVNYLVYAGAGVPGWDSWTVSGSNNADGSSALYTTAFSPLNSLAGWHYATSTGDSSADGAHAGTLALTGTVPAARYVTLVGVQHQVATGEGTAGWGMISEIGFAGTAPIPEPSSVVLVTSALICLLAYAWRRRK
jgi:hypothetical protein